MDYWYCITQENALEMFSTEWLLFSIGPNVSERMTDIADIFKFILMQIICILIHNIDNCPHWAT